MNEWIASTWLSQSISQSTWGFPILGALHVLAMAVWGGSLVTQTASSRFARAALAALVTTGLLLFWSQPVHTWASVAFRVKLGLLVVLVFLPRNVLAYSLWVAVVIASRLIAFV